MDLSAAQHQLHHHYLNHHHHQQQRQQELMESQSLDSMIACSSKQPTSITHPHRDVDNNNTDPNPNNQTSSNPNLKPRPADSEAQRCPRCDSTNTKFCYYNNYSLSQPRYFCKACRRYWTKGGTLRNVPVGGGCRKSSSSALTSNKRPSSPNSSFILKRAHTHHHDVTPSNPTTPPPPFYGGGSYASGLTDSESAALLPNPQAFGFFDSLRQGNGGLFQSLCYGAGEAVNAPFDDGAVTMMKQENEGRALWGFPSWQAAGSSSYSYGEAAAVADVEPVRGSWNGLIGNSASWHHGLLNTPALI